MKGRKEGGGKEERRERKRGSSLLIELVLVGHKNEKERQKKVGKAKILSQQ